jgi:hypothetical protein
MNGLSQRFHIRHVGDASRVAVGGYFGATIRFNQKPLKMNFHRSFMTFLVDSDKEHLADVRRIIT